MHKLNTYLALGDSYTIGESVSIFKSFPYQLVSLLRENGQNYAAPEIVARTGWTTDELAGGIQSSLLLETYDLVTLLIGVNNQYRGRTVEEFKPEFEELLKKAISFSNKKAEGVFVVSIPDYSVTPFAKNMETEKIAREIDLFNSVSRAVSVQYRVHYIDITEGSRAAKTDGELVATDGLHPSGTEYRKWAEKLSEVILSQAKK